MKIKEYTTMSKIENNVLVDLRVGIAGKKQLAETIIKLDDDIASKSDKAVKFNIPTITNRI
ncbi:MAG: hypothetical protein OI718_00020 (plasmid) [Candidatus Methanoperedens sp.]|nr:MAG: hypothetical protein OI718_00020 [Candidatus Methanoperedens sp.]